MSIRYADINALQVVVRAKPTISYDFDEKTDTPLETSLRSASEVGPDWADASLTEEVVQRLRHLAARGGAGSGAEDGSAGNSVVHKIGMYQP